MSLLLRLGAQKVGGAESNAQGARTSNISHDRAKLTEQYLCALQLTVNLRSELLNLLRIAAVHNDSHYLHVPSSLGHHLDKALGTRRHAPMQRDHLYSSVCYGDEGLNTE